MAKSQELNAALHHKVDDILKIFPVLQKSLEVDYKFLDTDKEYIDPEKTFLNESALGRVIYHTLSSSKPSPNIQQIVQDLLRPIYENPNIFLVLDNLIDRCYELFITNIPSLKEEKDLRTSITYLVAEYITSEHIERIEINDFARLVDTIFDHQIIPLISSLLVEEDKIKLTPREQEYLKSRGANLDFDKVLGEAQQHVQQNNKQDTYKIEINLSNDAKYSLPVIKCLISFEPEAEFIKRLEDPILQAFLSEYRDHIGRTALHYAAAKGKEKLVAELCKIITVDFIDIKDGYGRTALHVASSEGYTGIVETLFENRSSIEAKDGYDRTALHLAAINDQVEAIQLLTTLGIDLNIRDNFGRTPLHLAALFNKTESINILLQIGANIEAVDGFGRTPLHLAALKDQAGAIITLLSYKANPKITDNYGNTPIHLALKNDAIKVIKSFIQHSFVEVDDEQNTLLHLAVRYNSINMLKFLCSQDVGINIDVHNKYGSTALHHAAFNGNVEAINMLLKSGADATIRDHDGRVPLYLTVKNNEDMAQYLGADILSAHKVQAAAQLIDHDYSVFTRQTWNKQYKFSMAGLENLQQHAAEHQYILDKKVYDFVSKAYQFLQDNFFPIPHKEQDHIPLIIKVIESQDINLLKKLVSELPEFLHTLDEENKTTLQAKVIENSEMLEILNPVYQFSTTLKQYNTSSDEYVKNLNQAIDSHNYAQVEEILKGINDDYSVLTRKSKGTKYSVIVKTLYSGDIQLLQLIGNYIKRIENNDKKAEIQADELPSIVTVLEFSQFEDLSVDKCIEEYLKPLYVDSSISHIRELLDAVPQQLELLTADFTEEFDNNPFDLSEYRSSIFVGGSHHQHFDEV